MLREESENNEKIVLKTDLHCFDDLLRRRVPVADLKAPPSAYAVVQDAGLKLTLYVESKCVDRTCQGCLCTR